MSTEQKPLPVVGVKGVMFTDTAGLLTLMPADVTLHAEAQALVDRLTAERDAALADANRYRWLRDQDWFDGPLCVLRDPKKTLTSGAGLGADCPSRDRLDSAIDAALAATAETRA